MPLGKPSITTPRALQLQAVQQSIENIRERFRVTDEALTLLTGGTTQALSSQTATSRALQFQIDQLRAQIAVLVAAGTAQFTAAYLAAEDIDLGAPVWQSADGEVSNIDPDNVLSSSGYIGLSAQTVTAGSLVIINLPGSVLEILGSSFTTGRPLYAQLGGVTHSPAGNSLPVGVAISSTEVAISYGFNVLGDETFDPTGQDDMAMTYGLRGAAGSGGILPAVTGEVPPVLVYLPDGNLVYVEVP